MIVEFTEYYHADGDAADLEQALTQAQSELSKWQTELADAQSEASACKTFCKAKYDRRNVARQQVEKWTLTVNAARDAYNQQNQLFLDEQKAALAKAEADKANAEANKVVTANNKTTLLTVSVLIGVIGILSIAGYKVIHG